MKDTERQRSIVSQIEISLEKRQKVISYFLSRDFPLSLIFPEAAFSRTDFTASV